MATGTKAKHSYSSWTAAEEALRAEILKLRETERALDSIVAGRIAGMWERGCYRATLCYNCDVNHFWVVISIIDGTGCTASAQHASLWIATNAARAKQLQSTGREPDQYQQAIFELAELAAISLRDWTGRA